MMDPHQVNSMLAAIVQGSDDAIFGKNLDAIVTSWNRGAERIYGYKPEEIIGRSVKTIAPEDRHAEIDSIMERIRNGISIDHYETVRRRKDGQLIDVAVTISPVRNEAGQVVGASTVGRDITDRRRAEAALRGSEKLAAMGRMAASIAHEMRNPLDAAKNVVYLLKENRSLDREARDMLRLLDQQLTQVMDICTRTLSFARQGDTAATVSMAAILDEVLALARKSLLSKNVIVERRFDSKGEVIGYPGPLRQVCVNLVTNAIDALPAGKDGHLTVSIRDTRHPISGVEGVRVTIMDSGSGVRREDMHNLFQPFFSTKKEEGTGLGLWVSAGIVTQHGGTIRVRSRAIGSITGTAFSIFLPKLGAREKTNGDRKAA